MVDKKEFVLKKDKKKEKRKEVSKDVFFVSGVQPVWIGGRKFLPKSEIPEDYVPGITPFMISCGAVSKK